MKTRIITAIIILAVAIPTLILSGTIVYPIVISLLAAISVFELLRVFGCEKNLFLAIPAYLIALALPVSAYFVIEDKQIISYVAVCAAVLYSYLLYLLCASVISRGRLKFTRMASVFCSTAYAVLAFSALSGIRVIENGAYFIAIVFICSWVSDVFALFVGTLFGKHKLIPEISPKKTVEGCIGGIVFTVLAMLLYGFVIDLLFDAVTVNYLILGLMGLVLSVISQVGDLIASTIKREEGIKDFGNILPGHGGITDRFDSIYAIAMLAFVVCSLAPPFV